MPDTSTVVTTESWFTRIKNAFVGVVFGLAMVAGAIVLLWWNEGRAVHRARTLKEGASAVVEASPDHVDRANEGKLVHLSALATTDERLTDIDFGVSAVGIRLTRVAETYQWRETKSQSKRKKLGGSEETVTTYSYDKQWSERYDDSSAFHDPAGHQNPRPRWTTHTVMAGHVAFGAFELPSDLVSKIGNGEPQPIRPTDEGVSPAEGFRILTDGTLYRGAASSSPVVGDTRVRYEIIRPHTVSIVAVQRRNFFESYQARAGGTILLLSEGTVGASEMFRTEQRNNMIIAWVLRVAGFVLMFAGFALILRPLVVIGSFVPLIGTMLSAGTGAVAFFLALPLSLATIALAWLAYRPLLAGGLFGAALVVLLMAVRRHHRRARVSPPPLPGPPPIPGGPPPIPGC